MEIRLNEIPDSVVKAISKQLNLATVTWALKNNEPVIYIDRTSYCHEELYRPVNLVLTFGKCADLYLTGYVEYGKIWYEFEKDRIIKDTKLYNYLWEYTIFVRKNIRETLEKIAKRYED